MVDNINSYFFLRLVDWPKKNISNRGKIFNISYLLYFADLSETVKIHNLICLFLKS